MSNDSKVRVRFCPSPTGTPHVGLVRSCLFNWAWARATGGTFVFRIEDTDKARDSEDSYQMLLKALKWLNLNWDEGVEVGGPDAPYRQSERMDIYAGVVAQLLDAGYAYKCFSTAEEIEVRNKANGRPQQFGYDNFDRNLTDAEIANFEEQGRESTIRLKMPDDDIILQDIVRGEVVFKAGTIPDYVIVRANGQPLYTLVNPVDDALMRINCILRGEDLLSSTPRQIVLYRALLELGIAKEMPAFGHLPYVLGEGTKKLSKRDPESNLFLHRENGMIPEGIINYLSLLGWSLSADRDVFTAQELIKNFNPENVLANPARFDLKKCTAINAEHIRMLEVEDFKRRLVPYLHGSVSADLVDLPLLKEIAKDEPDLPKLQTYPALVSSPDYDDLSPDEKRVLDLGAELIQTRIQVLSEAREMLGFLLESANGNDNVTLDDDAKAQTDKISETPAVLARALEVIAKIDESDWNTATLQKALSESLTISPEGEPDFPSSLGLKPRIAFTPLRVAISGKRVSPPLFECMEILGKEAVITRLKNMV